MKKVLAVIVLVTITLPAIAAGKGKEQNRFAALPVNSCNDLIVSVSNGQATYARATYLGNRNPEDESYETVEKKLDPSKRLVPSDRLSIEAVMEKFDLSRFEALEVQALLRRSYRDRGTDENLLAAVEMVRNGQYLSGARVKKLEDAPFIVYLDADQTIWDQDNKWVDGLHEYGFIGKDPDDRISVAVAPGLGRLIKTIRSLGGAVAIYSRNTDELIQTIAQHVKVDGKPLADLVDAIFTSSHMVQIDEMEFYSRELSVRKDLSLFGLERSIIIDDDEKYVMQETNVRKIKAFSTKTSRGKSRDYGYRLFSGEVDEKFEEEPKKSPKESEKEKRRKLAERIAEIKAQAVAQFEIIGEEIEFAVAIMKETGVPFVQAYAPFTILGRKAVDVLTGEDPSYKNPAGEELTEYEAQDWIIENYDQLEFITSWENRVPRERRSSGGE